MDDVNLDYLFVDASFLCYHVSAVVETLLAAWCIDTVGKPVCSLAWALALN